MTAVVLPFRPRPASAGPCNSGTTPGGVSKPCGRTDTRPYPAGPRCPGHPTSTPTAGGAA